MNPLLKKAFAAIAVFLFMLAAVFAADALYLETRKNVVSRSEFQKQGEEYPLQHEAAELKPSGTMTFCLPYTTCLKDCPEARETYGAVLASESYMVLYAVNAEAAKKDELFLRNRRIVSKIVSCEFTAAELYESYVRAEEILTENGLEHAVELAYASRQNRIAVYIPNSIAYLQLGGLLDEIPGLTFVKGSRIQNSFTFYNGAAGEPIPAGKGSPEDSEEKNDVTAEIFSKALDAALFYPADSRQREIALHLVYFHPEPGTEICVEVQRTEIFHEWDSEDSEFLRSEIFRDLSRRFQYIVGFGTSYAELS